MTEAEFASAKTKLLAGSAGAGGGLSDGPAPAAAAAAPRGPQMGTIGAEDEDEHTARTSAEAPLTQQQINDRLRKSGGIELKSRV